MQWPAIEQGLKNRTINSWQIRTLSALSKCRTAALGGHVDGCSSCGNLRISYNSCRNRHCPKCQGNEREAWIEARKNELLPVAYFHVVFTLPSELNVLCMRYPDISYSALFEAAWSTIIHFAKDEKHLGATTGMISILHTWGQQLMLHPHLHCIIPAGGLTKQGKWKHSKTNGNYLFPVKALSKVFRAKYIHHLRKKVKEHNAFSTAEKQISLPQNAIESCFTKEWVVFAKKPFSGVNSVVEYLGRYTHKVAISNHRIKNINTSDRTISFSYKDYKDKGKTKVLKLEQVEFIRRFASHILPKSFVRIRHFGLLSNTSKALTIPLIRKLLPELKIKAEKSLAVIYNPLVCPCCKKETMITLLNFDMRGPPPNWKTKSIDLLQSLKN
jgi:hypothetical protein